jgi:hypothetical protein
MRQLIAGITLGCTLLVPSLAHAQRLPQPVGVSRAQTARIVKSLSSRRVQDKPPRQVVIETKFLEVNGEYRKFINWDKISGDNPAVVTNDTKSNAYGIDINLGIQLGSLPLWVQAGGYYSGGLETNAKLEDGETIHGDVRDYGAGAGLRLTPYSALRVALYLWAMGYYDRNDGDFEFINGAAHTENHVHTAWIGEYGVGAVYLIEEVLGINFGISYSGNFDKKNADENIRVKLGLILNAPREMIY